MLPLRRVLYLLPAVCLAATAAPTPTEACSVTAARCRCVPPASNETYEAFTRARYERADAVFQATVVRVDSLGLVPIRVDGREWSSHRWAARLAVTAVWKGPGTDTITVTVGRASSCDFWFNEGESYVVFASVGRDGSYVTTQCTGTAKTTDADATLAALGPAHGRNAPPP